MAKFGEFTGNQIEDVLSKVNSACGGKGIIRLQADELMLVEKERKVSVSGRANGGVTYETGINEALFRADWQKYLGEVFGITADFLSVVKLPLVRPGFGWGIAMPQGLMTQLMLDVLKPRFDGKLWQWCQNLDCALDPEKEARTTANGPYVIWCRDRVEADEELKNLSANDLAKRGTNCMTEPERIMLEGWFHWKTGGHLDIKNVTLGAGSRYLVGSVPNSRWRADSGFCISGFGAGSRADGIRAREVVSLAA